MRAKCATFEFSGGYSRRSYRRATLSHTPSRINHNGQVVGASGLCSTTGLPPAEAKVAINYLAVAADQHRDLEAELTVRRTHAIDGGVIFAGIAGIED
jgi:hypothetical protein